MGITGAFRDPNRERAKHLLFASQISGGFLTMFFLRIKIKFSNIVSITTNLLYV